MRKTALVLCLSLAAACETSIGSRDPRDGAIPLDAGSGTDAAGMDGGLPTDGGPGVDGFVPVDAFVPPVDAGSCTPTRTSCRMALECGAIPNGCPGGVYACDDCGDGSTWCAILDAPRWRSRVAACISSVSAANPAFFDGSVACSTGFQYVIPSMAMAFVAAVATCADGSGAIAIVDSNAPANEIRARGTDDDVADNYGVILYGSGCSSGRYTSSCTPAGF